MTRSLLLLTAGFILGTHAFAAEKPTIDSISVDNNDRKIVIVHFGWPTLPAAADVKRAGYWLLFSEAKAARRHTVVGVDTTLLNSEEAEKAGVDAKLVEHSIKLQLSEELPTDVTKLFVSLFNNKVYVSATSAIASQTPPTSPPAPTTPIEGAKNKADSDFYFNGSFTGVKDGDPVWDIDAFAGYMHSLGQRRYLGKLGFYGQVRTKKSNKADPNSFLTYIVYQRVLTSGRKWYGIFQAPYLNYRVAGWEFDRKATQLNFITSPIVTIPFRLSKRISGQLEPGLTFPHMTIFIGTEFVKNLHSVLTQHTWITRGILGSTFATGYAPEKTYLHSVQFTSAYQIRLPSSPEIFYDDRFAPISPITGKKGTTPPMLGTQPRHNIDTKITYNYVKWAGVTFEHTYGSMPPLFSRTEHSFAVGLTFTLKQTSYGRYSILKP